MWYGTPVLARYPGSTCAGKPGCFWSRFTATRSKAMGARARSLSRMSSSVELSLPPDMQTMTLSPASIMWKSSMALPTARHRRVSSLRVSRSVLAWDGPVPVASAPGSAMESSITAPMGSPLSCLDANGHFAVVKNLQLGQFDAHAAHAGQLHQAVGQLADQAFEQVDMPGRAFVNDDLAHAAVVEHMADVVVARGQGLQAQAQFGIDPDRLGRRFFAIENAQVGVEAQTGEREDLGACGAVHGHIIEKSRSKRIRCWPPSTSSVVPVMERFSSANSTAAATSPGVEERPSGLSRCNCANFCALSSALVSVRPGATPTTRTRGARARASMLAAASSAALDRG